MSINTAAVLDERAEFERVAGVSDAVFFKDDKYHPCGFTQYAKDAADHANTIWPIWKARAALGSADTCTMGELYAYTFVFDWETGNGWQRNDRGFMLANRWAEDPQEGARRVEPLYRAASAVDWVECSPVWLELGGDCAKAPRKSGEPGSGISHYHPAHPPLVPAVRVEKPNDVAGVSELGQALHDAEKWESLYRNEHATCTRLLDTMTGFRKERDALQKRLTGPVAIAMPDLEEEFPTWWENHGQYIRAGGGQYEISFAYGAYRDALAKVAEMNTTAGPDEVTP